MKYRLELGSLVALLVVGMLFGVHTYAAEKTQGSKADKLATEEVTLSVTGMT